MDAVNIYEEAARKVGRGEIKLKEFWEIIKPLRDVEVVVRCKDCRWRDDQSGSTAWMPCRALMTPNDFYCPSGERKGKR